MYIIGDTGYELWVSFYDGEKASSVFLMDKIVATNVSGYMTYTSREFVVTIESSVILEVLYG